MFHISAKIIEPWNNVGCFEGYLGNSTIQIRDNRHTRAAKSFMSVRFWKFWRMEVQQPLCSCRVWPISLEFFLLYLIPVHLTAAIASCTFGVHIQELSYFVLPITNCQIFGDNIGFPHASFFFSQFLLVHHAVFPHFTILFQRITVFVLDPM